MHAIVLVAAVGCFAFYILFIIWMTSPVWISIVGVLYYQKYVFVVFVMVFKNQYWKKVMEKINDKNCFFILNKNLNVWCIW